MDAATLSDAINDAGCPTVRVSVGDENDRTTWNFIPAENATQAQIDAGNEVIATIPVETLNTALATEEFIARWSNQEYLMLEKKRAADVAADKVGNAKNWDQVIAGPTINMTKKKTQSLKADLVADNILTQARADEIFQ
jgi:hypothetical protein